MPERGVQTIAWGERNTTEGLFLSFTETGFFFPGFGREERKYLFFLKAQSCLVLKHKVLKYSAIPLPLVPS